MVHWKVFVPRLSPDTEEVGDVGVAMVPVPAIKVHSPVPTIGVLPAKEEVKVLHKPWSVPALEVVGAA